jgi:hypothetical protein
MCSALERFFGYEIEPDITGVPALQPELSDAATYYATLVNTGIITANEARYQLNYDFMNGHDDLRIPQNITGSAVDPSVGGRPSSNTDENAI